MKSGCLDWKARSVLELPSNGRHALCWSIPVISNLLTLMDINIRSSFSEWLILLKRTIEWKRMKIANPIDSTKVTPSTVMPPALLKLSDEHNSRPQTRPPGLCKTPVTMRYVEHWTVICIHFQRGWGMRNSILTPEKERKHNHCWKKRKRVSSQR